MSNLEGISPRMILLLPPHLIIRGQTHAPKLLSTPCLDLLSSKSTSRSRQERSPLTSFHWQHLEYQENLQKWHGNVIGWTVLRQWTGHCKLDYTLLQKLPNVWLVGTYSYFNSPQSTPVCILGMPSQLTLGDADLWAEWAAMSENPLEMCVFNMLFDSVAGTLLLDFATQRTFVHGGNLSCSILLDCKPQQVIPIFHLMNFKVPNISGFFLDHQSVSFVAGLLICRIIWTCKGIRGDLDGLCRCWLRRRLPEQGLIFIIFIWNLSP